MVKKNPGQTRTHLRIICEAEINDFRDRILIMRRSIAKAIAEQKQNLFVLNDELSELINLLSEGGISVDTPREETGLLASRAHSKAQVLFLLGYLLMSISEKGSFYDRKVIVR